MKPTVHGLQSTVRFGLQPAVYGPQTSSPGIALVMVLGILSVMVIMAVAFAISMRTERVAAGNYADSVRARQLVHVGLARALDDINAQIQMCSCFVIDIDGPSKKIVLVRPNHDFQLGDEVKVFSPSNVPSGLDTNLVYKVSAIDKGAYSIQLSLNGVLVNATDVGACNDRVITNDALPALNSAMRSYVLGTPIRLRNGIGSPSPSSTKYVIPVDGFHIHWAASFSNALKGIDEGPGAYNYLELQPLHGIYPVVANNAASGDKLIYNSDRERLRTGMAVRLEPAPSVSLPGALSAASVYYVRYVSNQVITTGTPWETNRFIQLCDSYTNAVANRPISTTYTPVDKVVIIPIQSVVLSNLAIVSYSTNQASALSDYSELVTIDSALDTVNVKKNYYSGEDVAFTRIDALPSQLQEKNPYYVIVFSNGAIQLAASIANALASPPVNINLTGGSGTNRIYKLGLSGEATNYIPRAVYTKAEEELAAASSNAFDGIYAADGELKGKVRYVITDCSGLLDANYVGGGTRYQGVNPNEFQLANLSESAGSLPGKRTSYIRYETLRELADNLTYPPVNLFVYSYSRPEQWDWNLMNLQTPINIGGDPALLVKQITAITNALWLAGVTSIVQAEIIYSNLIDYVDDDLIPSNFEYGVESVPMINEVVVSNAIEVSAGIVDPVNNRNYKVVTDVYVECWYPFVSNAAVNFSLNVTNKFSGTPGFQHADNIANITPLISAAGSAPVKYHCGYLEKGPFELPMVETVTLTTTIDPKVQLSGRSVDVLKTPIVLTTTHDGNNISVPPDRDNKIVSLECLDPRFNYDPNDSVQWRLRTTAIALSNALIADVNPWVTEWWPAHSASDGDDAMFVANRQLLSVAELGYLAFEPWRTIKLYGPNLCRVLDVFAIATNTSCWFATNQWNHGQINPNTKSFDVMKAWFQGMSVDKYPGQTVGASTLDLLAAQQVAQKIVDHAGSYKNLSDLGRVLTTFPVGTSELEKEAYFRNTCGLFNVHQNVFTILIEAKVASGGNIPRNPVRQRAVALVWRDPYTGEMFVRQIKWLKD